MSTYRLKYQQDTWRNGYGEIRAHELKQSERDIHCSNQCVINCQYVHLLAKALREDRQKDACING